MHEDLRAVRAEIERLRNVQRKRVERQRKVRSQQLGACVELDRCRCTDDMARGARFSERRSRRTSRSSLTIEEEDSRMGSQGALALAE